MEERLAQLNALLGPSNRSEVIALLAPVFASFPSKGTSEAGDRAKIQTYAAALVDLPLWAISEACEQILKGTAPGVSPDWLATSAQFRIRAADIMKPWADQRDDLSKILGATIVVVPARASGVKAAFQDVINALAEDEKRNRRDTRLARTPEQFSAIQEEILGDLERKKTEYSNNAPTTGAPLGRLLTTIAIG